MGWWDDLTWGVSRAFNTYKTLYENPNVRRQVVGRAIDEVSRGNVGDRLVDAVQAGTFLSGANANDLPPVALELVRAGGNATSTAIDLLPAIGAVKAGISTGANVFAGRDPQLENLFAETALAFAPTKVSTAVNMFQGGANNLPALSALIKKETQPISPKYVPESLPKPLPPPTLPRPPVVAPAHAVEPRIQPEVPIPTSRADVLSALASHQARPMEATPFTLPKPHYRTAPKKRKRKL